MERALVEARAEMGPNSQGVTLGKTLPLSGPQFPSLLNVASKLDDLQVPFQC